MESTGRPPPRGLLRSSAVVGAMTMISRVLGLVRDAVFARVIGTDGFADAFFVA
ncbi:MAG TPA: murein biosynthesis integral membrane protein MurJ, partial [Porticoccaceae bacterium]|nr:murein biosynthesis integral membrane protein MurJ [Porticoccaceae bacterium]